MTISCIIPSYNQQEYLPDAIDSALDQVIKFDEIIVVDDGSTDNSLDIAKRYIKDYVTVIEQVNKGLASARNTGIMFDQSDFCFFLDADDQLLDTCVKRIKEEAIKHPDADIIAPSFKEFGISQRQVILMDNPTLEDFKTGNRVGYCAAIARSALLEVGGYSPKMVYGYEDLHLWFNLLSRGKKLITIPEVLWLYRTKEHSMIHDALQHHEELMAQIRKDFPW